jgi:hypothetical protein
VTPLAAIAAGGAIRWRALAAGRAEAAASGRPLAVLALRGLDHWSARWLAELVSDADAAALLDQAFVPVLVDVDREPGLARTLQLVLAITAESQGWPLLACADADGRWLGASAWRPLRDQERSPGTLRLLVESAQALATGTALPDCTRLARMLDELERLPAATLPAPAVFFDNLDAHAMAAADQLEGGFGPAPRRPDAALLGMLLARPDAAPALRSQRERTLATLCASALHDHLGGGFFRAVSDTAWREPFAEKRARDSALLIPLLLASGGTLERAVARQAGAWLVTACQRSDGLIAHGIHADSPAAAGRWESGAVYRWTALQAADVVGDAGAELLARRFDLGEAPAFPAVRGQVDAAQTAQLPALTHRLAVARSQRAQPRQDETAFVADQGMALMAVAALAKAEPDEPLWTSACNGLRNALPVTEAPAWWEADGSPVGMADVRACAWLGRGLLAVGDRAAALTWAAAALAAPLPPATDDEDGPAAVAVLAHLCADLAEPSWTRCGLALVLAHAALLRRAPLAMAGLAHAWWRLIALEQSELS